MESVLLQGSVRTFLVFYVLHAFILVPVVPVTGMLNFLVNWMVWLKVAALVAWLVCEKKTHDARAVRPDFSV